jgi:hypothetical protein
MRFIRKTYAYDHAGKQYIFHGHIKKETAHRRNFCSVVLSVFDQSGKGRSENRFFCAPFTNMGSFY